MEKGAWRAFGLLFNPKDRQDKKEKFLLAESIEAEELELVSPGAWLYSSL